MENKNKIPQRAFREVTMRDEAINAEARTAELTFMTEAPCDNWWTPEVVICNKDAADLTRLENKCMPLLFNHNRDKVIGTVESVSFEDGRAKAVVKFFEDEEGDKVFKKVQAGLRGVSVGYLRTCTTRVKPGITFMGRTFDVETDVTSQWQPLEISIVSIPADADAGVGRSMEEIFVKEITGTEDVPQEDVAEIVTKEMEEVEVMENKENIDVQAERDQAIKAERERCAQITEICRASGVCTEEQIKKYVEDGTSVENVRAALFTEMCEQKKPAEVKIGEDYNNGEHLRSAIVEGLCLRHGLTEAKDATDEAKKYRNLSLRGLAEMVLENNGVKGTRTMSADQLFQEVVAKRTMGSEQFSGIVDDFAHKTMMKSYEEQPFIFRNFVSIGQNVDFKPTYRYEMGLSGVPVLMAHESSEFTYQDMSDAKISTGISTYGKGIAFTREIFINDSLGQVQRAISLQAAGFRRLQEKLFFEMLTKGVTYGSGNTTATNKDISAKAYSEMSKLMRNQKDLNNEGFIGVPPTFLIASVEYEDQHRVLLHSTSDPSQNNPNVINTASGRYKLFTTPYLEGKAYYVAAAPNQMAGIEYTTLNGVDAPQSRTVIPQEYLGLKIQMWQDFGFNKLSDKAFVKNDGSKIA